MPRLHPTDSRELAALRARYQRDYDATATPYRLGRYAAMHGIPVSDYGAHSRRWIDLFDLGRREELTGRPIGALMSAVE